MLHPNSAGISPRCVSTLGNPCAVMMLQKILSFFTTQNPKVLSWTWQTKPLYYSANMAFWFLLLAWFQWVKFGCFSERFKQWVIQTMLKGGYTYEKYSFFLPYKESDVMLNRSISGQWNQNLMCACIWLW